MSNKAKKIVSYISIVLVSVILVGSLGFMTKGFTERDPSEWIVRERNCVFEF